MNASVMRRTSVAEACLEPPDVLLITGASFPFGDAGRARRACVCRRTWLSGLPGRDAVASVGSLKILFLNTVSIPLGTGIRAQSLVYYEYEALRVTT